VLDLDHGSSECAGTFECAPYSTSAPPPS
jgi:hypothetical protein